VLGAGRELESGTATAVWAAALEDRGEVKPFHATAVDEGSGVALEGLPELDGATAVIILSDPYTFPTDAALSYYAQKHPAVPVLGGLASSHDEEAGGALFFGEQAQLSGAVGVSLEGVEVFPCVSQGAAPLGPELTITRAEGRIVHELAGKPALVRLREVFEELSEDERRRIRSGLLLGIVIDAGKPEYEQGDFLVRGVVGADADEGSIALGEHVRAGQIVRLHARDAQSADRDLEAGLEARRSALGAGAAAGALCFTCTGRGRGMFGVADHDAGMLARVLPSAATAGFFAAGEIGPVHGESFQHSFSASVAVFAA
jgi:small ligand-binding sensory domain FIST